jgi:hypothetical protein
MTITSKFRLSRRAVLAGAGGIAIALPWLEIMSTARPVRAAAAPAGRFLTVYNPGGTVLDQWRPTGTETSFTLSPILQPFEPVRSKILVLDGLDMRSAVGEQDAAGMVAWLTGNAMTSAAVPIGPVSGYVKSPSVDQVIARRIAAGRRYESLQLAVRWGTGKSKGRPSGLDIVNFRDNATFDAVVPLLDPVAIWNALFGNIDRRAGAEAAWDKSMLDFTNRRYASLMQRLGAPDRARLDQHLTTIREMEKALRATTAARCSPPILVDTSDYDPLEGLNSSDDGSVRDLATDAAIPKVGKLMMDMMVMAFACDLTAVGTIQRSDAESKHTIPWLNLNETHRYYQNDGGYHPVECAAIARWYSEQHAYLLQRMAAVDMGGHSLLDESVVFFGSHIQNPATHVKTSMPFVLAGGGGGLRTGRLLTFDHVSHNNLLVSLLQLFGDLSTTFGNPAMATGPLPNLT